MEFGQAPYFYLSIGKLEIAAPCRTDSSRVIVPKLINTVNGRMGGTVTNSQSTQEVPVNNLMQSDQTDIAHAVQDLGQISRSSNMKIDLAELSNLLFGAFLIPQSGFQLNPSGL